MSIFFIAWFAFAIAGRMAVDTRAVSDFSRYFHRSSESTDNRGYVEQCRPTNLAREELEHVNVFAFLDPAWYYSYRQTIMLELLQMRLKKSGFSNILFFVVTPPLNLREGDTENDAEMNAWREISRNVLKSEYFLEATQTLFNDRARNKQGITFLRDTPDLGIWDSFHASKNEVVIVDRCGRLTYQVIVPWSILYFPYVKAAILSTYKEDPCGSCDVHRDHAPNSKNLDETTASSVSKSTATETFADSETVTTSFEELNDTENGEDHSGGATTTLSLFDANLRESGIYETTTVDDSMGYAMGYATGHEETQTSVVVPAAEATVLYDEIGDRISEDNDSAGYVTTNDPGDRLFEQTVSIAEREGFFATVSAGYRKERKETGPREDEGLPLRITLYAPHLHNEDETLKKYTHLILKFGSPDYHDHFSSKATSDREPTVSKQPGSTVSDDRGLDEYVHGKNESPGVYGEIADYWRTMYEEEFANKHENTEFPDYDYATAEDIRSEINDPFASESSIPIPNGIDALESDTNLKSGHEEDQFTQRKLIQHYSKLLSWIYYIL